MDRGETIDRLKAGERWDVLVIGGGASGLGAAIDAAARGYRTALVERGDFAEATSSRSTKLIHGGVRYLQQFDFPLVREAVRERGRLVANAPHLVHPLPFVVPNYRWWERAYYGAGLSLYDALAGRLGVGETRHLTRDEMRERMPTVVADGLRGGILYHDAQFDDARLAITMAATCADLGGAPVNHARVSGLIKQDGRTVGAEVVDEEAGSAFEVRAKVIVNATGIFSDELRRLDEGQAGGLLRLSQGAHLVLPESFLPGGTALLSPKTEDGRVFFAIPWHGRTLVGTTETPVDEARTEAVATEGEIEFLLEHTGRYLGRRPSADEVLSVFAGIRPLVRSGRKGAPTSALSRSHRIEVSGTGLVSVMGGKWTTYRQMAEDTIDAAAEVGGLAKVASPTAGLRLHGAADDGVTDHGGELSVYGSDAAAIGELCRALPDGSERLSPKLPYSKGEVVWAVRCEMARTLGDVLSRRLRALLLDARAAMEVAPEVASVMAAELGRDGEWAEAQVAGFRKLAASYLPR